MSMLPPHVTVESTRAGWVTYGLGIDREDGTHGEIHHDWTPEQAREVARRIARAADEADGAPVGDRYVIAAEFDR